MSARLAELTFTPRGTSGWVLPPINFGAVLTLVMGPNGTGKSPVMKGLAYALGHPIELPPGIRQHCQSVVLTLADGGSRIKIERELEQSFTAFATDGTGDRRGFSNEAEFAEWLIERLGIPARQFVGLRGELVRPYMGLLLPLFWIDQDLGWRNLYSALHTSNFVRDQPEEMIRWMLAVPARHRPVDRSAFAKAKAHRESVGELIAAKRNTIETLQRAMSWASRPDARDQLTARRSQLLADLRTHTSVLDVLAQSDTTLDGQLAEAIRRRDAAKFAVDAATRQLDRLRRSGQELEAEVGILEMNEVAADAFRVLCGNEACQFFRKPEESYGKKLLYLKDQLKDFGSSFKSLGEEIAGLQRTLEQAEAAVTRVMDEKKNSIAKTKEGQLVPMIDGITRELSEVNLQLEQYDRLAKEREQLEELIVREHQASVEVAELRPTGGGRTDQSRLTLARSSLGSCFKEWLVTLNTQNIDPQVSFDEDMRLHIGSDRFSESSPYGGSTRTRIVLAFHAALVECSLKIGGNHPGFLLLDAPKQQELHPPDLGAFVGRFRQMSERLPNPVQLVIAATERDFLSKDLPNHVARPRFGTAASPRFFGPPPAVPKLSKPKRGTGGAKEPPAASS